MKLGLGLGTSTGTSPNSIVRVGGANQAPPGSPIPQTAPVVSGTSQQGQTLSVTNGTWTNSPTSYTYQWKRNGSAISGATSNSYALVAADVGATISCTVFATNAFGTNYRNSNSVGPVTAANAAPVNTATPVVSGTATEGQTLSTTNGTWTGSPAPTYTYQWRRGSTNISGATNQTYVLTSADVGSNISCVVTATNTAGSASATSNSVGPVAAAPASPVNTAAPVVSGTPTQGQTLTITNGTWTGNPAPTYAYQWLRDGATISGATSQTYALVAADAGTNVSCRVTATNTAGSASATSNSVGPIAAAATAPSNTAAPVVSGTPTVGQTLTTTNGTWSGNPTPTYTYQWRRNGTTISGATSQTYLLVTADVGTNITCAVTATNSAGSATAVSNSVGPVQAAAGQGPYTQNFDAYPDGTTLGTIPGITRVDGVEGAAAVRGGAVGTASGVSADTAYGLTQKFTTSDQSFKAQNKLVGASANSLAGCVKMSDSQNNMSYRPRAGGYQVLSRVAGTFGVLGITSTAPTATDIVELRCINNSVTLYRNDVAVLGPFAVPAALQTNMDGGMVARNESITQLTDNWTIGTPPL